LLRVSAQSWVTPSPVRLAKHTAKRRKYSLSHKT
jgi:hypothetical protein